ncbi:copper chaperone PCu(A)C [Pseudokineococcus sp. 1T1Z-3]|uniref:copper chaperone PCu(A)C n=1 Tax=Pseudokineococcus sp. 1T1Z-3 TaxID=3132745 RepID=UPI0030B202F6
MRTLRPSLPRTTRRCLALPAALALGAAGLLAGCGADEPATDPTPATTQDDGTQDDATQDDGASGSAEVLEVLDPWVVAADEGMTAAFGTLENTGDADVRITAVSSPASSVSELHEMAMADGAMVMREKDGGFVVPAGGSHVLEPGGDHLMLMDLLEPLQPGQEVTLTLTAEDGSTLDVTAPARSFSGAQEEYVGGDDHSGGMSGMDGGDMDGGGEADQ